MLAHLFLVVVMVSAPQSMPPKTVTFPSMVKTSGLKAPSPDRETELDALLEQALTDSQQTAPDFSVAAKGQQSYVARFRSKKAQGQSQILIPESGEFQLVLQAGNSFKILDDDATDGQAKIQFPANTLETLLHTQGPLKGNSSLHLKG